MDPRTKWLLQQPSWWFGLAANIAFEAVAVGLVPEVGTLHRVIAGIIGLLGIYGVTAGTVKQPPRLTLEQMSEAQRERLFKIHPDLRAKYEAQLLAREVQRIQLPPHE